MSADRHYRNVAESAESMYMFPTNLTTNEVKNSSGTEVEFLRMSVVDRKLIFAKSGEVPDAPHRITVSHSESGVGVAARRRSLLRVDQTVSGASAAPRVISAYVVVDIPVGDITTYNDVKNVIANLISLLASTGADTTIKFDCSGYGATALSDGSL